MLQKLEFAWVKFHAHKSAKYCPAFIYPADADGIRRAQKVNAEGYVCNIKNIFFGTAEDNNIEKKNAELTALNKMNTKFGFSYN